MIGADKLRSNGRLPDLPPAIDHDPVHHREDIRVELLLFSSWRIRWKADDGRLRRRCRNGRKPFPPFGAERFPDPIGHDSAGIVDSFGLTWTYHVLRFSVRGDLLESEPRLFS